MQKPLPFLYTNNERLEREIKEALPFIIISKRIKHLGINIPIDYAKAFHCVDHNKLENSERDENTRSSDLPLEKSLCRSGSNS